MLTFSTYNVGCLLEKKKKKGIVHDSAFIWNHNIYNRGYNITLAWVTTKIIDTFFVVGLKYTECDMYSQLLTYSPSSSVNSSSHSGHLGFD